MQTAVELIKETIKHYTTNERGIFKDDTDGDERCVYFNSESKTSCAVGRCLTNPSQYEKVEGTVTTLIEYIHQENNIPYPETYPHSNNEFEKLPSETISEALDGELKPEYRGHTIGLWRDLQNLHDNDWFWRGGTKTKYTLTNIGMLKAKEIILAHGGTNEDVDDIKQYCFTTEDVG